MKISDHLFGRRKKKPAIDPSVMESLTFKELSLHEIKLVIDNLYKDRMGSPDRFPVHVLDLAFPYRLPFAAVCASMEVGEPFFKDMLLSEYEECLMATEKSNPRFVKIFNQMNSAAKKALAQVAKKEGNRYNGR